jgi:Phage gp6-like head-tail connector protein
MHHVPITTITAPTARRMLTQRATVKSALMVTDDGDNDYIDLLINQASAAVEQYCNRAFVSESLQDQFIPGRHSALPGHHGADVALVLSRRPVTAIASVVEDGATLTPAQYVLDPASGILRRLSDSGTLYAWRQAAITVTFTAGYVLPGAPGRTLPYDIEDAVLRLVKHQWFSRLRDPAMKMQSVAGVGEEQYWIGAIGQDGNMPPDVTAILDNYRDSPV